MRLHRALLVVVLGCVTGGCSLWVDGPAPEQTELQEVSAFWLPINSERFGASGLASASDVCVGLVWSFSTLEMARTPHCDDFVEGFPYAVVRAADAGGCSDVWDYAGNATVSAASGCIDPDFEGTGTLHVVDVTAEVTSELFTGLVHVATP